MHSQNKQSPFNFTFREKHLLDKVLTVLCLIGENEEGEPYHVYCGINGKMLDAFYKAVDDGVPIDIDKFGTIIAEGPGAPDYESRTKTINGYLFNEKGTYAVLINSRKKAEAKKTQHAPERPAASPDEPEAGEDA